MKKILAFALAFLLTASLTCTALAEGFTFNWDSDDNTAPHCKSLLLLNLDTGNVVYAMNPDEQLPMASLTKIMSYIVAYETIPNMETATITMPQSVDDELSGTGSSVANMFPGEQFSGLQLLHLMMIPSGNNAALTLAKHVDSLYTSGQITAEDGWTPTVTQGSDEYYGNFDPTDYTSSSYFVHLMNEKAKELGCGHTHFTNPHGLHNPAHYTTARDMAVITQYAMTLPSFTEITGTTYYEYTPLNSSDERYAQTTNRLLTNYEDGGMVYYYPFATGIKTGSLDESGYCLAASATAYGYTYVAICLGSPMVDEDGGRISLHGEMLDAASLFRWALTTLEKKTLAVQGEILSSIKLESAWQKDELQLMAQSNAAVMLPEDVDGTSVVVTTDLPESIEAPVERGDEIGTAIFSYAGEEIATVPLVAAETVERSEIIRLLNQGREILTAPWFLLIVAFIGLLILVYIVLILVYRRKQRSMRTVRRHRDL